MGLSWQLRQLSWPELRYHPWRHATAWFAVVLGVALAFSVQLINSSALGEFSAAVRSVNGQPDFGLRAQRDGYDEALQQCAQLVVGGRIYLEEARRAIRTAPVHAVQQHAV